MMMVFDDVVDLILFVMLKAKLLVLRSIPCWDQMESASITTRKAILDIIVKIILSGIRFLFLMC